jgi:genome maintenance exonuclease 1
MHTYLERYVLTDDIGVPGTNPYAIQAHNMAKVIVENALDKMTAFYGTEIGLFYPGLYAGSTDLVCEIDGELAIGDYKQALKKKKESYVEDYKCQLTAYILAHNELYDTDIRRGIIMICTGDLEYQQFEVTPSNFDEYTEKWFTRVATYYNTIY